jgi:CRISPR/Cas system-associated exonuclease Cas4 (RecB family)
LERGNLVHKALEVLVKGALASRGSSAAGTQAVLPQTMENLAVCNGSSAASTQAALSLKDLMEYATKECIADAVKAAMKGMEARSGSDAPGQWMDVPVLREVEGKRVTAVVNKALDLLKENSVVEVRKAEEGYTTELEGLRIRFRADLEARTEKGRIFVDWKTSKKPADLGIRKPHLDHGTTLQAAIYASYEDADGTATAQGVYAYVDQEFKEEDKRWLVVTKQEFADALSGVLKTLGGMIKAEQAPPRVAKGADSESEPDACQFCEFTRACVLGDSHQRRLLAERGAQGGVFGAWWSLSHSGSQGASHA